jgi:hypothetical protein
MQKESERPMNWVALYGHFDTSEDSVTFVGGEVPSSIAAGVQEPTLMPLFGLAICDRTLSDGWVSADVTFSGVDDQSGCELILAYDVNSRSEISAGIRATRWTMFEIRGFTPGTVPPCRLTWLRSGSPSMKTR